MVSTGFAEALAVHGPAIRKRLEGWDDDGKHIFVATWPRSDGSTDAIAWKTREGLVGCLARHEHFNPGAPVAAHWLLVNDESD